MNQARRVSEIRKLVQRLTLAEIARKYKVSRQYIHQFCREHGIPTPKHERPSKPPTTRELRRGTRFGAKLARFAQEARRRGYSVALAWRPCVGAEVRVEGLAVHILVARKAHCPVCKLEGFLRADSRSRGALHLRVISWPDGFEVALSTGRNWYRSRRADLSSPLMEWPTVDELRAAVGGLERAA